MRIGMIARADNGGLGNQTWEFWRHVKPDATVLMMFGDKARGGEYPERYQRRDPATEVIMNKPGETTLMRKSMEWLLERVDVVYSAETFYREDFTVQARQRGVGTVLHANPELYRAVDRPTALWAPTHWEVGRMPAGTAVVRFPVATERFTPRVRSGPVETWVHMAAPAMLDRNGTELVLQAITHVKRPVRLVLIHSPVKFKGRTGRVTVETRGGCQDYWESWDDETFDMMVMPRRYAGLCLPLQEAAAAGIATLQLQLKPQEDWPGVAFVPPTSSRNVQMAGGVFPVWSASPTQLAKTMDLYSTDADAVAELSAAALMHAQQVSWDSLLPEYLERLSAATL